MQDTPLKQVYPVVSILDCCGILDRPSFVRKKTFDDDHLYHNNIEEPLLTAKKSVYTEYDEAEEA